MSADGPADILPFAQELADAAGEVIRPLFRTRFEVIAKADASPVTIADRESERVMREMIMARYPSHGIYGEEFGVHNPDAEYVWILDPVDGTRSFVAGLPIFATLIGLRRGDEAILGVIDQPITGERWWAAQGHGAFFQGQSIRTRACANLGAAALYCTSTEFMSPEEGRRVDQLRADVNVVRLAGDAYGYGLVAAGFADIAMDATVQLYDYAALVPIFTEAGGQISDWEGRPLDMRGPARVIASGDARIHAELVARLGQA